MKWYNNRKPSSERWGDEPVSGHNIINRPTAEPGGREVVLLIDIFTNYHEPEVGKAAVQVLESQGFRVIVPDFHELGRPQISKGMLTHAKNILDENLPKLFGFAGQEIPIIGLEPSEILTLRDEFLDLCDEDQLKAAKKVAQNSFTFEEFTAHILTEAPESPQKQKVYVHGHCHAKALIGNNDLQKSLELAGYEPTVMDTGCCGMAGSFGYEEDHYNVSMDIGELRLFPAVREIPDDAPICAPGFSCRHQIKDGTGRTARHPAQFLAELI